MGSTAAPPAAGRRTQLVELSPAVTVAAAVKVVLVGTRKFRAGPGGRGTVRRRVTVTGRAGGMPGWHTGFKSRVRAPTASENSDRDRDRRPSDSQSARTRTLELCGLRILPSPSYRVAP